MSLGYSRATSRIGAGLSHGIEVRFLSGRPAAARKDQYSGRVQEIVITIHEWCTEAQLELLKTKTEMTYLKYNSRQKKKNKYKNKRYSSDTELKAPVIKLAEHLSS